MFFKIHPSTISHTIAEDVSDCAYTAPINFVTITLEAAFHAFITSLIGHKHGSSIEPAKIVIGSLDKKISAFFLQQFDNCPHQCLRKKFFLLSRFSANICHVTNYNTHCVVSECRVRQAHGCCLSLFLSQFFALHESRHSSH